MLTQGCVSIIIPVYNMEKYLEQCILSIINQSYNNVEIVLVNDGSTDRSYEICKKMQQQDERIKVISQKNKGVCYARNKGLLNSRGEYVLFIDPDDFITENMIEKVVNEMKTNDYDCMFSGFSIIDEDGVEIRQPYFSTYERAEGLDALEIALKEHYGCVVWNKMFRKSKLYINGKLQMFDTQLKRGEDRVWLSHVLPRCNKIGFNELPLYRYRMWKKDKNDFYMKYEDLHSSVITLNNITQYKDVHLEKLIKSNIYALAMILLVAAYMENNRHYQEIAYKNIKKYKRIWMIENRYSLFSKIRLIVVLLMIKCGVSRKIVYAVYMKGR